MRPVRSLPAKSEAPRPLDPPCVPRRIPPAIATRAPCQKPKSPATLRATSSTPSLHNLASHRQVQLAGSRQISPHQVQIVELHIAILFLRIQEIEQRSRAVLIRKRNRVSYAIGLF